MSPTLFKHKGYRSGVEVNDVSPLGIWMLINEREYYIPFIEFPWFRNAPLAHVQNVKEISPNHYFWEDLDVDLTLNMIADPYSYPLRYTTANTES